jgi:hypothetical protein
MPPARFRVVVHEYPDIPVLDELQPRVHVPQLAQAAKAVSQGSREMAT